MSASPSCRVAVIREATKIHEEILRGSAAEVAALPKDWKGEIVVGVHPADPAEAPADPE